jgi:hypothetical protein
MRPTDLQTYKKSSFFKYNLSIYLIISIISKYVAVGRCRSERKKRVFLGRFCRSL